MDFPGQWQHFSVPVTQLEESSFEEGFGFDGSSIRGWKAINESDMLIIPDPDDGVHRSVHRGEDAQPDLRRLRSDHQGEIRALPAQHRPEGGSVPEVHRHRRHGVLRRRGGVLHLRRRPLRHQRAQQLLLSWIPSKGRWNSGRDEMPNLGYKPRYKEGYFPVPPTDQLQDLRNEMTKNLIGRGLHVEAQHHEVATAGQSEIDLRFAPLLEERRRAAALQVHHQEHRAPAREDRHLHAEADLRRQRLGDARPPEPLEGREAALLRQRLRQPERHGAATTSADS